MLSYSFIRLAKEFAINTAKFLNESRHKNGVGCSSALQPVTILRHLFTFFPIRDQ